MQNILVCSSIWIDSHCTPYNWNGLGYCFLCLQPAWCCLALSISKRDLLHLNFYSWTCSKGEFGNFFFFMGIYIEAYFIGELPRNTYCLAHGSPIGAEPVTTDVRNKLLCILQCKTKKCKPEWQEVILLYLLINKLI